MNAYRAYRFNARRMTSETVSPRSAAFACAAFHTSSGMRTERSGVCDGLVMAPFNAAWHSRLPHVQRGPWRIAFVSHYRHTVFAVAFWHNPSARGLPQDWLELRRMAVAPDAPHCTASHMLGQMRRQIRVLLPDVVRLVSYQDQDVHTGTIYRAAGWSPEWITKPRVRDRSGNRKGTRRAYRSDANGLAPASSAKTRWESTP